MPARTTPLVPSGVCVQPLLLIRTGSSRIGFWPGSCVSTGAWRRLKRRLSWQRTWTAAKTRKLPAHYVRSGSHRTATLRERPNVELPGVAAVEHFGDDSQKYPDIHAKRPIAHE